MNWLCTPGFGISADWPSVPRNTSSSERVVEVEPRAAGALGRVDAFDEHAHLAGEAVGGIAGLGACAVAADVDTRPSHAGRNREQRPHVAPVRDRLELVELEVLHDTRRRRIDDRRSPVTANINVELALATLQETVTVTGESPVIDTSATRVVQNFKLDQLQSIPNGRDMWSLLAVSPGVAMGRIDVGGNRAGTQTPYTAYGFAGQVRVLIEGINTTEGTGAAGFYFDYSRSKKCSSACSASRPRCRILVCKASSSPSRAATSSTASTT